MTDQADDKGSAKRRSGPQPGSVAIERRGSDYVVIRYDADGNRSELALTFADLFSLQKIIRDRIEFARWSRRWTRGEVPSKVAVPIGFVRFSLDRHGTSLVLTFIDGGGNEDAFLFTGASVEKLAGWLSFFAQQIREAEDKAVWQ